MYLPRCFSYFLDNLFPKNFHFRHLIFLSNQLNFDCELARRFWILKTQLFLVWIDSSPRKANKTCTSRINSARRSCIEAPGWEWNWAWIDWSYRYTSKEERETHEWLRRRCKVSKSLKIQLHIQLAEDFWYPLTDSYWNNYCWLSNRLSTLESQVHLKFGKIITKFLFLLEYIYIIKYT